MIPDYKKDQIKRTLNLVDVVQRYIPLKQEGAEWVARCPSTRRTRPASKSTSARGSGSALDATSRAMPSRLSDRWKNAPPKAIEILAKQAGVSPVEQSDKAEAQFSRPRPSAPKAPLPRGGQEQESAPDGGKAYQKYAAWNRPILSLYKIGENLVTKPSFPKSADL